jgi:gliding motility-associated-like protein
VVAKVYEIHADYPFFQVCEDVDTIEVKVNPQPEITITASETAVLPGAIVQFGVSSSNTILETFLWVPTSIMPNPYIANPIAVMHETTLVSVQVSDAAGCTATASILIEVDLKPNTVLTPNADGKNDTWIVSASGLSNDYQLIIYNRWGSEVLNQQGYSNDWDGTSNGSQLPDGAYYYIIKHGDVVYTGSINLLR